MSIGLAKTQIANPANISGGGGSSLFGNSPLYWSRIIVTDSNLSAAGFINDGPLLSGVNLTASLSSTTYQGPGADIMLALLNTTNGVAGTWSCYMTNGDRTAGQAVGVRWGNIKVFTSRFFPKPTANPPANSQNSFFFGVCRDVGVGGLNAGIATVAATPTWMNNIACCGFYYTTDSPFWQLLASDGAGNSTKVITAGISPNLTTTQELTFTFDGTTITYYIAGNKAGAISNNIPGQNTGMCLWAGYGNIGSASTAQAESFGMAYMAMGIR